MCHIWKKLPRIITRGYRKNRPTDIITTFFKIHGKSKFKLILKSKLKYVLMLSEGNDELASTGPCSGHSIYDDSWMRLVQKLSWLWNLKAKEKGCSPGTWKHVHWQLIRADSPIRLSFTKCNHISARVTNSWEMYYSGTNKRWLVCLKTWRKFRLKLDLDWLVEVKVTSSYLTFRVAVAASKISLRDHYRYRKSQPIQ